MKITLEDLPEEVIRYIFGYLSDAEVQFGVSKLCKKLEFIASGYVTLGMFIGYISSLKYSEKLC